MYGQFHHVHDTSFKVTCCMLHIKNHYLSWILVLGPYLMLTEWRQKQQFGYYIAKEQKSFSKLILNMLKTLDSTLKEEKRLNNNFRSGQLFYSIYCMHKLTIFVPLRKQWFSKKLPVERCQLQVSNLERRMSLKWWKKKTNKQIKIINKQLMDNKKHITAFYIILLFFSQNRIRFICSSD